VRERSGGKMWEKRTCFLSCTSYGLFKLLNFASIAAQLVGAADERVKGAFRGGRGGRRW
jgi:hypothetical protein